MSTDLQPFPFPTLMDCIQVPSGGPLAEHPLRPPHATPAHSPLLAEQLLLLPASALRGSHRVRSDQPIRHPSRPMLIEVQLPRGMIQSLQRAYPEYQGRIAIHSMVLDAHAVAVSPASPRPAGTRFILVQAIIQEQVSSAQEGSLLPPATLLGVTLRSLDRLYRPIGQVTQFLMRTYQQMVPATQWEAIRQVWSEVVREWSGVHLGLLHRFEGEWTAAPTHRTPTGQAIRVLPEQELDSQHVSPSQLEQRLTRLLSTLKQEAPQAWKGLPGVFQQGMPNRETLLSLLPAEQRHKPLAARVLTLGVWRLTRGVYRIDETVLDSLWNDTSPPEVLPTTQLRHLPEHAVYLPLPGREDGQGREVYGAFVTLTRTAMGEEVAVLALHTDDDHLTSFELPVGEQLDIRAALERGMQMRLSDHERRLGMQVDSWTQDLILNVLNIAFYLCAVNAEVQPQTDRPVVRDRRTGLPVQEVTFDVGVRLGAALRHAQGGAKVQVHNDTGVGAYGRGQSMPPHVRRAHFHTYVYGPQEGERVRRLKWLPPIPINLEFGEDLPITVRPVQA